MLLILLFVSGLLTHTPPHNTDTTNIWAGPVAVRSHAMLFDNRLSYTPGPFLPLAVKQTELVVALSHANLWAQMPRYFFDGEWTRLILHWGYGLAAGWEIKAEWGLTARWGGFLDQPIEGFHHALGITQARRDSYPRNQLLVETINAKDGSPDVVTQRLGPQDAGVGLPNPVIGIKKQLSPPDTWPLIVAEWLLKLPLGHMTQQFATPHFATLVNLGIQQPLSANIDLFADLGLIVSPLQQSVYGMPLNEVQKFMLAGLEARITPHATLVFHYLNQDGIVEACEYSPLNQTTHEFVLGGKWTPTTAGKWLLEMAIIENSVHDANTADIALYVASRWRWE